VRAPYPTYPYAARANWLEGSGVFEMTVRADGVVLAVTTVRSTGHAILDDAARASLKQWQFRPLPDTGRFRVPIRFVMDRSKAGNSGLSGVGPRGERLTGQQIQSAIVAAPRIHYPRLSRLVRSHGRGEYEMRVDPGTGKVTEVVILRSAGARLLDIECMRALGHWQFKPGTVRAVRQSVDFRLSWRATMPESGY
jgi:TonB family protein